MLIGLLLIAFLTIWGIAFVLFERDLACPTMLLLSGYTLSVAVAFFSDFKIPFVYHSQTVFVLIVGTLLFCIPAYAIKTCYAGGKGVHPDLPRSVIDIRSLALLLYAAGLLGTIALSFWVYRDILAEIKPTLTYAESVNAMRNYLIANPDGVKIPELFLLNQIKKVFRIAGYFLLVIWARNAVVRRSFVKDKLLFLNLILTVILFGTEGGRTGIVAYVLAGVALCFFFNRLYNNTRITISGALVVKALGVFLVASVAFYAMLYLSGRQSGALHIGALIHHVQFYLGGSIPLLDNFLLTSLGVGGGGTEIIGKETFYSLVQLMSKLHITDIPLYSVHLEFRPGVYDGNVYTGFRSYIHDFGYAGLIVLPVLFSVCANWLYYAAVQASREKALAVGLVLYATLMYPIFADFVRCFFFLSFFSINTLWLCLGVILLQLFLLKTGWMRFSPVTSKARSSRSR